MARGESKPSICWDCARACGLAEVNAAGLARKRHCQRGASTRKSKFGRARSEERLIPMPIRQYMQLKNARNF